MSLEGAVIAFRDEWNGSYYGKPVRPADILVRRVVTNPHSAGLREAVMKEGSAPSFWKLTVETRSLNIRAVGRERCDLAYVRLKTVRINIPRRFTIPSGIS